MINKRMVAREIISVDNLDGLICKLNSDNRTVSRAINDIVREVNRNEKRAKKWRLVELLFGVITVRDLLIHGKELKKLGMRLTSIEENVLSIKAERVCGKKEK